MTPIQYWYRAETHAIADRHGLDPDVATAVVLQESAGRTEAFRHEPAYFLRYLATKREWDGAIPRRVASSYGLMQLMYPTALDRGYPKGDPPEYLFVPTIGLEYGCRHLAWCLAWADGDTKAMCAAYNGGATADNGPSRAIKRNQSYVEGVLRWLARVKAGEVTG